MNPRQGPRPPNDKPGRPRQESFAGGEISPALYGRTEIPRYAEALRLCRNFLLMPEGTTQNRPGTAYAGTAGGANERLIPFMASTSSSYMLEFQNGQIVPYQGGQRVLANYTAFVNAVTNALEGECYSWAGNFYRALVATSASPTGTPANWQQLPIDAQGRPYLQIKSPFTGSTGPAYSGAIKYAQSGSTMLLCASGVAPQELVYYGGANSRWTIDPMRYTPSIAAPAAPTFSTNPSPTYSGATTYGKGDVVVYNAKVYVSLQSANTANTPDATSSAWWTLDTTHPGKAWDIVVTAVSKGPIVEESIASAKLVASNLSVYPDRPATYTWAAVPAADYYFVYRGQNGTYGYIGKSTGTTFRDDGQTPLNSQQPPSGSWPFDTSPSTDTNLNPRVPMYHSQRAWLANTYYNPFTIWATRQAQLHSMDRATPLSSASDAMQATMATKQYEEIRSLLSLTGDLLVLTSARAWACTGIGGTPPNPADGIDFVPQASDSGSSWLDAIYLQNAVLYVSDPLGRVIELAKTQLANGLVAQNYMSRDLSFVASHLFDNHYILDWCYQRTPLRTLWMVREDGVLLSLSYIPETQQVAWAWHDTSGTVEAIASMREGNNDVVYLIANRGGTRHVEYMASRIMSSSANLTPGTLGFNGWVYLDDAIVFDGYSYGAPALVVSGAGPNYTLTAATAAFVAGDVGAQIKAFDGTGLVLTITGFTSSTVVTVTANIAIPAAWAGVGGTLWGHAYNGFTADHITAATVSIIADGTLYTLRTKVAGKWTLPGGVFGVKVIVGLPYTPQIQLLDLQGLRGERKVVKTVWFEVRDTVPAQLSAGQDFTDLIPWTSDDDTVPDATTGLVSFGYVDVPIDASWNQGGSAVLQGGPFPVTVLAVIREVESAAA